MRHLRYFAILLILLFAGSTAQAQNCTVFVAASGGSGAFAGASSDLSAALGSAGASDVVCVATGTYTPGSPRTNSFTIGDFTVVGGFAGNESAPVTPADRVVDYHTINPTILDGDYDNDSPSAFGDATSNYKVVNITGNGVLDGFIVSGGNDDRPKGFLDNFGVGGGVTVSGTSAALIVPTIQNSIVTGNHSTSNGAGVAAVNGGMTMKNVVVHGNGAGSSSSTTVSGVTGVTNLGAAAIVHPITMEHVTITENGGGSFFDSEAGSAEVITTTNNSILFGNGTALPAGSALFQDTKATLNNTIFESQASVCAGAGVTCTNVSNVDPLLSGATDAPGLSTPAVDYGDNSFTTLAVDGVNEVRELGSAPDAGWREFRDTNADISFAPASPLDLGSVFDNAAPVPFAFDVNNGGIANLDITAINILTNTDGGYSVSSPSLPLGSTVSVASGSPLTVSGTYTPTALGTNVLDLEFVSNDPDESPVTYSVTVNVVNAVPNILVDGNNPANASSGDFGVLQPSTSDTKTIAIGNDGDADLTVNVAGITFSGPDAGLFSIVAGPTSPIAPGNTDNLDVEFAGNAADGTYTATMSIPSDDPDGAIDVALQATISTKPPISATVIPFPTNTAVPAGPPALDVGDYFALAVTVGEPGNDVDRLFGLSFELNWDPNVVTLATLADWDARDNDPGINQLAEDQQDASQPVVGVLNLTGDATSTYASVGPFMGPGGPSGDGGGIPENFLLFEEVSQIGTGLLSASVTRRDPAVGVNGNGIVAYYYFRVNDDVVGLDGTGIIGEAPVLSSFTFADVRITKVYTSDGTAVFDELSVPSSTGEFQVIDRAEKYPGDHNDDGEVVIFDATGLLQSDVDVIGQCFGAATDPLLGRDFQDIKWEAKDIIPIAFAAPYDGACAGLTPNLMFADSDGDGEVDEADVLAVGANLSDSQSDFPATKGGAGVMARLVITPDMFDADNKTAFNVVMPREAQDFYGFAAAFSMPENTFDVTTTGGTLLAEGAEMLSADGLDQGTGYYLAGISRIFPAAPVSGSGPVMHVELEATNGVPTQNVEIELIGASVTPYGGSRVILSENDNLSLARASTSVATEDLDEVPTVFSLEQNYPNPFNPTTTITYKLAESSPVRLTVYDMLGRMVGTLVNTDAQEAGSYQVKFDAGSLASGMYIYRLETGQYTGTRTMQLLK